jgi:hypothetical protein
MTFKERLVGTVGWCAVAFVLATGGASAATVNEVVDFNDGTSSGGAIKTYVEDGFSFYDARIVGGPCEFPGADKCAALNKHEATVLTRGGLAFDLTSIWFYLNGKAEDLTNSLVIFETLNPLNRIELTQADYAHNTGHTVALNFLGVTSITFESGGLDLFDDKGKLDKDQGNARFDTLALSYDDMPPVPLPAAGWMLIAGIGGLAALRRRKRA